MAPGVETAGMLKPPQAMVEAQKSYELLCFPKERHSPRSVKDRIYMEQIDHMRRELATAKAAAATAEARLGAETANGSIRES